VGGWLASCWSRAAQSCDGLVLLLDGLDPRGPCVQPPAGADRARAHLYEAPGEPDSPCAALVDATRPVPPGRACPRGSLGITENISPACSTYSSSSRELMIVRSRIPSVPIIRSIPFPSLPSSSAGHPPPLASGPDQSTVVALVAEIISWLLDYWLVNSPIHSCFSDMHVMCRLASS